MSYKTDDIPELKKVSSELAARIKFYDEFRASESNFGRFMKENSITLCLSSHPLIPIESVFQFVMVDGAKLLDGLSGMYQHLNNWKQAIDNEIKKLEEAEFPSEGSILL